MNEKALKIVHSVLDRFLAEMIFEEKMSGSEAVTIAKHSKILHPLLINTYMDALEYLIWSNEHNAWWGEHMCGYTDSISLAGRYTRARAISICRTTRDGWNASAPSELPILLSDLPQPKAGET